METIVVCHRCSRGRNRRSGNHCCHHHHRRRRCRSCVSHRIIVCSCSIAQSNWTLRLLQTCDSCLLLFWLMCTYRHIIVLPTVRWWCWCVSECECSCLCVFVIVFCFILNSNNLTIWHIWHNVAHFLSNSWRVLQFSLLAKRDCPSRGIKWNSNNVYKPHLIPTFKIFDEDTPKIRRNQQV